LKFSDQAIWLSLSVGQPRMVANAAGIVIGVDEGRSVDAIAALPPMANVVPVSIDWIGFALDLSSQPCREPIGGVEQPGIAGFRWRTGPADRTVTTRPS